MKWQWKLPLALLVAFVLSLGLFPISSSAAEVEVSTYDDLKKAIDNASDEMTIKLGNDLELKEDTQSIEINDSKKITLLGNGHTIKFTGKENGITVSGKDTSLTLGGDDAGKLVISGPDADKPNVDPKNPETIENVKYEDTSREAPLINVKDDAALTMNDGVTLTDNWMAANWAKLQVNGVHRYHGGGVYVEGGSFTMKGGTVKRNSADWGGGVFIASDGKFTMSGGSIEGNVSSWGAGLCVMSSTADISGNAKVDGNRAMGYKYKDGNNEVIHSAIGGGIALMGAMPYGDNNFTNGDGALTIKDSASVSNNICCGDTKRNANNWGGGIGIAGSGKTGSVPALTLNINGGAINGNMASNGGGVSVYCSSATGGTESGASSNFSAEVKINMTNGEISGNKVNYKGGGVDLNGEFISFGSGNAASSAVFHMSGGKISNNEAIGYQASNNNRPDSTCTGGGVNLWGSDNNQFYMTGGEISGNKAVKGGGVHISDESWSKGDSIAALLGGVIQDNRAIYGPPDRDEKSTSNNYYGNEVYQAGVLYLDADQMTVKEEIALDSGKVVTLVNATEKDCKDFLLSTEFSSSYTLDDIPYKVSGNEVNYGRTVVKPGKLSFDGKDYQCDDAEPYVKHFTHKWRAVQTGTYYDKKTNNTGDSKNLVLYGYWVNFVVCTPLYAEADPDPMTIEPILIEETTAVSVEELCKQVQVPTLEGNKFSGWMRNDIGKKAQNWIDTDDDYVQADYDWIYEWELTTNRSANLPPDTIQAPYTFYAAWEKQSSMTFDANGGAWDDNETSKKVYIEEGKVTLPKDPVRDGWNFVGWNTDKGGKGEAFTADSIPADGMVVYAQWQQVPKSYTVTFEKGDHGSLDGTASFSVKEGESMENNGQSVPAVKPADDYTFIGWKSDIEGDDKTYSSEEIVKMQITQNITFTAQYKEKENPTENGTMTFDPNGGAWNGDKTPQKVEIKDGKVTLPKDPVRDGWVFVGWNTDKDGNGEVFTKDSVPTDGMTVYAQWKQAPKSYDVIFDKGDHGSLDGKASFSVEEGKTMKDNKDSAPEVKADSDYTFIGWKSSIDGKIYGSEYIVEMQITQNVIFTAQYKKNETMMFDPNGGAWDGDKTPQKVEIKDGKVIMPKNPVRDGWNFVGWNTDKGGKGEAFTADSIPADGMIVYAQWKQAPKSYDVIFDKGAHGSLDGKTSFTVKDGATMKGSGHTVPGVKPNDNYTFIGWKSSIDGKIYSSEDIAGMKITGDVTFTAQYKKKDGSSSTVSKPDDTKPSKPDDTKPSKPDSTSDDSKKGDASTVSKTGDDFKVLPLIGLMIVSMGGLIGIALSFRNRKRKNR